MSGSFLLETGKETEGAMELKRTKDSEAIEAGGSELLNLQMLGRGFLTVPGNGIVSQDEWSLPVAG